MPIKAQTRNTVNSFIGHEYITPYGALAMPMMQTISSIARWSDSTGSKPIRPVAMMKISRVSRPVHRISRFCGSKARRMVTGLSRYSSEKAIPVIMTRYMRFMMVAIRASLGCLQTVLSTVALCCRGRIFLPPGRPRRPSCVSALHRS